MKKSISLLLISLSLLLCATAPVSAAPNHTYYEQYSWVEGNNSLCYCASIAMVLTDSGIKTTPLDIYKFNGNTAYCKGMTEIANHFGAEYTEIRLTPTSQQASNNKERVETLLKSSPQGVILYGNGHMVVATGIENGTIYFNDPAHKSTWVTGGEHIPINKCNRVRWDNVTFAGTFTKKAGVTNSTTQLVNTEISFHNISSPGDIVVGSTGNINGEIHAVGSPIRSVTAEVCNANDNSVLKTSSSTGFSVYVYGPLKGSKIDKNLGLNSIPAGSYFIKITASTIDGAKNSINTGTFQIKKSENNIQATPASTQPTNQQSSVDNTTPVKTSITFNSLTTPGNLTVGDKGHIDGSVTSTNSPITSVIAEIHNASTGQTVRTATTNGFSLYTYGPIKGSKLDKNLNFESLSAGTYFISYTAKCKDGTQATKETSTFAVFSPAATESPKATIISFNSLTTPGNLIAGNGGHIDGSISSSNSPIISVRAEVYSSSTGSAVMSAKTNGFSLPTYGPIKNSKLDNDLSFGSLGADTYYIRYTVNCKDGTQATKDTSIFTISAPSVVETPKTTSITFSSLTTPGNLTVGNGGHIDGSISSSNSPITSVRADVYNSSTGNVVMSAYTSGFSLPSYGPIKGSKLDNDLTFGSLSAGSYFIQYTVTCADGTQRSDATPSFQVSAPASAPTSPSRSSVVSFNSLTTPGNLKAGNGAHIDGSITSSGAPIVTVRAYVIDESTGDVVLSASTSGFSLSTYGPIRGSKIDNELTFGSLPVGTYHIHYAVSLSDGTLEVGITSSFQVHR